MSRTFRMNDQLREPGAQAVLWQVMDPFERDGRIRAYNFAEHCDEYKRVSELHQAIVDGELILVRKDAPRASAAAQNDPALDQLLTRATRQVRQLQELQRSCGISFHGALNVVRAEHEARTGATTTLPSRATLYRYARALRNGLPPLRGDKCKGNRKPRYEGRIVDIIDHAIRTLYLVEGSLWNLKKLTSFVNDRVHDTNLLAADRSISQEFVRKVLDQITSDADIDRMDPKDVPAAKSIGKNRIVLTRPFQRVEQDAVHLPFVVRTQHGITSNVWLIHSIDCFTSVPVGWRLVIGAPSESEGLRCVESILFSKLEALQRLGLSCDFDPHGTPDLLVFDNGPEAKGERMDKLTRLGIEPLSLKSRHPHHKPFIERLNRSLKEALELLPGCTRQDGEDGKRDPVKLGDELRTVEQLEAWIARWYFEDWIKKPLKRLERAEIHEDVRLGSTPHARWCRVTQGEFYATPMPPVRKEWQMCLYEHEERTLSRKTGITVRGFNYKGPALDYLIRTRGERKVKVFIDPDDYRQVHVDDGDERPWITLFEEFVDQFTPAHSFTAMQERLKQVPKPSEDPSSKKFRQDLQNESIQGTAKSRKPRRSEANKAVSDANKDVAARQRAAAKPLGAAPGVAQPVANPVHGMSFDDLPDLEVVNRFTGEARQ